MHICVFCGASERALAHHTEAAFQFGVRAARAGHTVVYGGCSTGLMGATADGALSVGGCVIGVLPKTLMHREPGHPLLTQLITTDDLTTRKLKMAELSDAFVALPGGYGTLDELFEVLTDRMIGGHAKPVALLDVQDAAGTSYWATLVAFLDHAAAQRLVQPSARASLWFEHDADALLSRLTAPR